MSNQPNPPNQPKYNPSEIEPKWQKVWEEKGLNVTDISRAKKPFYNLMMFPYPSAEGLHVGNMYAFTTADIYGRFKRLQGYDVFEPIGLDGFGIHSENHALKVGRHPKEHAAITEKNFYRQLHKIGAMFDWTRTVETYNPNYYKWTQWLFIQMFKKGLAYRGKAMVNFCPKDKTVLSDEQVIDGKCERCGTVVEKRETEQWFFRITDYAQRLLSNLPKLDWSEKVKVAQKNWIGKKQGHLVKFGKIEIFTTRVETIFGATFIVLSPKHALASKVRVVINPANSEKIPVFVDDYVLGEVGTGAIMGVPAYDQRDLVFAQKNNLPIVKAEFASQEQINTWEKKGIIRKHSTYHLRDWLISRQRYWGPPIPMIFCPKDGWVPVPESELPVLLPDIPDYEPEGNGKGPLANHPEFYKTTCPHCQGPATRETDVSDVFLDSAWYELRYPSVNVPEKQMKIENLKLAIPWDPQITKRWLPVSMYTGGAEHAVLHLMYFRFVTMVLHDMGLLNFDEPTKHFFAHGLLIKDGAKMSKSRGNVINPDEYIAKYGADALRLYLMFMGPVDLGGDFRDSGMEGMRRWVDKLWRIMNAQISKINSNNDTKDNKELQKGINNLISLTQKDIEGRKYNTAISALMIFLNEVGDKPLPTDVIEKFLLALAPFAPHLAEELFQSLRQQSKSMTSKFISVHQQPWPAVEKKYLTDNQTTIVISVNGKPRSTKVVSSEPFNSAQDKQSEVRSREKIEQLAKSDPKVSKYLEGQKITKVIYVPGKIINFVI